MPQTDVPQIEVAAGVVYNDEGAFLLSSRPQGKPYAGYWEFAGGKLEAGEDGLAALRREFAEELGMVIRRATPWLARVHVYEHAVVRLRFWRVAAGDWQGGPRAREGQEFIWCQANALPDVAMLPANAPILKALTVPTVFSGSLKRGLASPCGYRVAPLSSAGERHDAVLSDLRRLQSLGRLPEAESVWIRIEDVDEVSAAADADVLVLAVHGEERAQAALALLADGVGVPLLIAADTALCRRFAPLWLAAGAQAVLADDEVRAV